MRKIKIFKNENKKLITINILNENSIYKVFYKDFGHKLKNSVFSNYKDEKTINLLEALYLD